MDGAQLMVKIMMLLGGQHKEQKAGTLEQMHLMISNLLQEVDGTRQKYQNKRIKQTIGTALEQKQKQPMMLGQMQLLKLVLIKVDGTSLRRKISPCKALILG